MVRSRPFGPPVPWAPRLLLLAALLFGIVTMHTLGHPGGGHGGSGGHEGAGTHASAVHPAHPAAAAHHGPAATPMEAAGAVDPAIPAASAVDPTSAGGMDPMAVCLAVLAGWTLVLLLAGPLLRRSGDAAAEVRARLLRAVRALPPPGGGRILLTRLSVLRQ
ncbi:hypothetical protein DR950_12380 [Kitasatospora xanthocidica]|uniref:Uncharacterized protein n=1 Tax=Kitasatospora xanthocidica TaxID=83382 RepID=A0A372ZRS4_9ACTN|nr:hypothetical protein [Kitasatospora xanthocidica]RGD58471.1 hypothetical protein DR950_12380 [Kitasatospora xanthocidica]